MAKTAITRRQTGFLKTAAFAATGVLAMTGNVAAQDISVAIDEARLLRLERPGAEIVVGNPSIADISVQNGQLLVVTGKSYGISNIIVLDTQGREILNRRLRVTTDTRRMVTLHKGKNRHTLDCHNRCETALVPGDAPDHFDAVSKTVRGKFGVAQSAVDGSAGSDGNLP
jgi:hypothetical protein